MQTTSLTLLDRLRQPNDQDAWRRFVSLYTPLLIAWGKRLGIDSDETDDFVQEVLLLLLDKLRSFEHRGVGSFRGWLKSVAVNKSRERFRRRAPPGAIGGDDQGWSQITNADDPTGFWQVEYRQHLVARALQVMQNEFEPKTWQACWQRVVEERPAAEIAETLGLSEAAVYVYSGRVLRRLREELRDLLD